MNKPTRLDETLMKAPVQAQAWLNSHGFPVAGEFENEAGERLDGLLAEADGVEFEGSVPPRWIWPDGSAVVARFGSWEVEN